MDHLLLGNHLDTRKDLAGNGDGRLLDFEVPILDCLLAEKLRDHGLNLLELVLRSDARVGQGVTHAHALAGGLGNSVEQAELSRQVEFFLSNFDKEERLILVSDMLLVGAGEVLSDGDLLSVLLKA